MSHAIALRSGIKGIDWRDNLFLYLKNIFPLGPDHHREVGFFIIARLTGANTVALSAGNQRGWNDKQASRDIGRQRLAGF
jgi:hypothetical protein